MKLALFIVCLLTITVISSIDAYINIKYGITSAYEENPIARKILQNTNDDLGLLMALKMMGTVTVTAILTCGFFVKRNYTLVIATMLAIFQIGILTYMLTA